MSNALDNDKEVVLEGEVQSPNTTNKIFHSVGELAEFLLWVKPVEFQVVTGRDRTGTIVYQIQYRS